MESKLDNLPCDVKPIPGFAQYFITRDGVIYNCRGRKLSQYSNNGYRTLSLRTDAGKRRGVIVHRAVWEAYVEPIPKGMWINHKNGVRHDNRLENLECDTPSHNHLHASRVLKRRYAQGEETDQALLTSDSVEAVRELHKLGWSLQKIARAFHVTGVSIWKIINKKSWNSVR